jgi:hypothetical protein
MKRVTSRLAICFYLDLDPEDGDNIFLRSFSCLQKIELFIIHYYPIIRRHIISDIDRVVV